MERVVYKHAYNHLVKNNLIYKYESGFFPKHSTVHQPLELYNSILNSLEKKNIAIFSKDFDKVWHKGLIHKINSCGIQGNLIKWFENYLYKRKQKIINKNSCSCLEPVSAGVPQGSVLGTLMFLIYINDIGEFFYR
jgi:sarcosine oxidase/L-pipecolate oxidase